MSSRTNLEKKVILVEINDAEYGSNLKFKIEIKIKYEKEFNISTFNYF